MGKRVKAKGKTKHDIKKETVKAKYKYSGEEAAAAYLRRCKRERERQDFQDPFVW